MDTNDTFSNIVERPSGFYDIPCNDLLWISVDGRCINKRTGNSAKVQTVDSGYKMVMVNVKGKTYNFYHHRLMARAFLQKPARHADKSYEELEVNHIDGVRDNNSLENLEWVTPEENIDHAIKNGLKVLELVFARDIRTNEIVRYFNATECANAFGVGFKRLQRHLRSVLAGYVTKNWHVFKLDNGQPWPRLREEHIQESTWDSHFGVWIATSVEDEGKTVVADTLRQLCDGLGWNFASAQSFLNYRPEGTPYLGWVVAHDETSLSRAADRVRNFKDRALFPPKDVLVTNSQTGEQLRFASRNLAASALGIHADRIRYALKAKDGVVDHFHFVEA